MPSAKLRELLGAALLLLPCLAPGRARAEPTEYQVNVREACRRDVAGAYLEAYDAREQHRKLLKTLDEHLAKLRKALASARADLARAQKAVDEHSYEAQLDSDRDAAQAVVSDLATQVQNYEAQRKEAASQMDGASSHEARLRAEVERVFVLHRVEDKPDGGYPFIVEYRAPCPKYRALCPLPAHDAEQLRQLDLGKGLPETCAHYASFSRIP